MDRKKYFKDIYSNYTGNQSREGGKFDRSVLLISSGALALSVALLGNIEGSIEFKCLLYAAWIILGLNVILNVTSYLVSSRSVDLDIRDLIYWYENETSDYFKPKNRGVVAIFVINVTSLILLIVGIGLLLFFSAINI